MEFSSSQAAGPSAVESLFARDAGRLPSEGNAVGARDSVRKPTPRLIQLAP